MVARKCNPLRWFRTSRNTRAKPEFPLAYSLLKTQRLSCPDPISKAMRTHSSPLMAAVCILLCLGFEGCHKSAPHWVTLTWDAPAARPGVSTKSYNVYRSTTSGGPFVKLASHVPAPPYEDRLVTSGHTYFYVVTALDQAGHESRFSGEIRAAIP